MIRDSAFRYELRSTSINSRKSEECHCSQSFKVFASGPSVLQLLGKIGILTWFVQVWEKRQPKLSLSCFFFVLSTNLEMLRCISPQIWQLAQIFSRHKASQGFLKFSPGGSRSCSLGRSWWPHPWHRPKSRWSRTRAASRCSWSQELGEESGDWSFLLPELDVSWCLRLVFLLNLMFAVCPQDLEDLQGTSVVMARFQNMHPWNSRCFPVLSSTFVNPSLHSPTFPASKLLL